jgi:hypothetical protein
MGHLEIFPDDEFYAAYAMVAPPSTLKIFKYKVKFQPGNMKKGKAWQTIVDFLTKSKLSSS